MPTSQSAYSKGFYFPESPNVSVIDQCTQAYNEMEGIVKEVEIKFNIQL